MASGRQALAIRTIDTLLASLAPDDEATMLFFASKVRAAFPWTRAAEFKPVSWIEWRAVARHRADRRDEGRLAAHRAGAAIRCR